MEPPRGIEPPRPSFVDSAPDPPAGASCSGVAWGNRTPVVGVRGRYPGPLDECDSETRPGRPGLPPRSRTELPALRRRRRGSAAREMETREGVEPSQPGLQSSHRAVGSGQGGDEGLVCSLSRTAPASPRGSGYRLSRWRGSNPSDLRWQRSASPVGLTCE